MTKATAISIPAATPEDVQRSLSCTHRAEPFQSMSLPKELAQSNASLLLVAAYPSSKPAAAKTAEPVHMELGLPANGGHVVELPHS